MRCACLSLDEGCSAGGSFVWRHVGQGVALLPLATRFSPCLARAPFKWEKLHSGLPGNP